MRAMNPKEAFLEAIGRALEKVGFFPPDGSPEQGGYGWGFDQFGDSRDCDTPEEFRAFQRIFEEPHQPPTAG